MREIMTGNRPHLVAFGVVLLVALLVVYLLGSVLLVLGISAVLAYVLLPVARFLERWMPGHANRPELARGLSVGVIFLAALGILIGVLVAVVPPTIDQGQEFAEDFPEFLADAQATVEGWVDWYGEVVSEEQRTQIEDALANVGDIVGQAALNVVEQTFGVIAGSFAFILGLATAPVLIFVFMSVLDVRIGLVFVVFALVTLFLPAVVQKLNRRRNQARRKAYGDLGADFLDSVQGLATLKAFGQAKRRGELLAVRARTLFRTTMKVLAADGLSGGATVLGMGVSGLAIMTLLMLAGGATVGAGGAALIWSGIKRLRWRKGSPRQLQRGILRLASQHGGRLTASEVAAYMDLSPDAAKKLLDGMELEDSQRVCSDVTDEGVIVYEFPELRPRPGRGPQNV